MELPFGVIPTTLFVTPLAVLAALFPATFAGLARGLVNWRAFLVTFGILSTLSTIYYFVRPLLPDAWWVGLTSFTCVELLVLLVGVVWATRRHAVTAPNAELPTWKSIGLPWQSLGWRESRQALREGCQGSESCANRGPRQ